MPETGVTIGVEYEIENFIPKYLPDNVGSYFSFTHDASCEMDMKVLNCGLTVKEAGFFPYRNQVVGGEFVSKILNGGQEESLLKIFQDLCGYVIENGETPRSDRAGIHVHVTYPNVLIPLKSSLRLWKYMEDVFFRVGGMGYPFRGMKNDSIYTRPLTQNGPIIVPTGFGYYAKSLNIDDLLEVKSTSSFWERWGDFPRQGGTRYFPVRYHALNLSPISGRGSIEFRVFNKTVNPFYLYYIVQLCRYFVLLSASYEYSDFSTNKILVENSVYFNRSTEEICSTLATFAELSRMPGSVTQGILDIIQVTPPVVLPNVNVYSHLRSVGPHWNDSQSYVPKEIPTGSVSKPHFVDIHVLRGR